LAELAQLVVSPIYRRSKVPNGGSRSVLVIPALFAGDLYVYPMRNWLRRQGYDAMTSTLVLNAGCPERLCRRIETQLQRRMKSTSERVALIGHSRGGILARAIAARLQDEVSHLILLGSPIGALAEGLRLGSEIDPGLTTARVLLGASARARRLLDPDCNIPACGCPFPRDFQRPLSAQTKVVSIYSREDPIVPPSASQVAGARNVEVAGTHSGLVYNQEVYEELSLSLP
jgi:predicted esterase